MQQTATAGSIERPGILNGIRVIDLSRHKVGATASLLLAELGADVVRVRLVQDRGQAISPLLSLLRNRDKRVVDIDLHDPAQRQELLSLSAASDVIVMDRVPQEMQTLGLTKDILCSGSPGTVFATIGGWPASDPRCNRPVDDTLILAETGLLDEQAAVDRDGPAFIPFPLGSAHAAFLSAIGVVVRLLLKRRTGTGGEVGTSLVQGALLPMMLYWSRADRPTASLLAGMPKNTPQPQYQCRDGTWIHVMGNPARVPLIREALESMGPDKVRKANTRHAGGRPQVYPDVGALAEIFSRQDQEFWLRQLWDADVPVQPVREVGALVPDEQVKQNGYIRAVQDAVHGTTLQAALPVSVKPAKVASAATLTPDGSPDGPPDTGLRFPLQGVRVLDFGCYLAGPLAPMLLADLGAEVIKIEECKGEPLRAADWAFNASQRGKRALAIDLTHQAARDVLRRLVEDADVVHHNLRAHTACKLGIDEDSLRQINPDLVVAHVSAYGPEGPRSGWPGYDQLFQAASGWEVEAAGEGNRPTWLRFGMMDHLAALASLLGTVAGLYARDRGAGGQSVAASLLAASLFSLETAFLEDGSPLPYPKLDKRQLGWSAAQRLYQCADGWIAVSLQRHEGVAIVLDTFGCETVEGLESTLSRARVRDVQEAFENCEVPCARVATNNEKAFFDEPLHREQGLVTRYPHPVYGNYEQIGAFWNFGDMELSLDRAPPLLGQHTREVLTEIGYRDAEIDALLSAGAIRISVA